jgi:hypothetical protein
VCRLTNPLVEGARCGDLVAPPTTSVGRGRRQPRRLGGRPVLSGHLAQVDVIGYGAQLPPGPVRRGPAGLRRPSPQRPRRRQIRPGRTTPPRAAPSRSLAARGQSTRRGRQTSAEATHFSRTASSGSRPRWGRRAQWLRRRGGAAHVGADLGQDHLRGDRPDSWYGIEPGDCGCQLAELGPAA